MADIEVAYYDKAEANSEKSPKPFDNFTYDNKENGGVLQKFSDIGDKIKSIKSDIINLNTEYGKIIKKYEAFSNFETSMNSIINTMTTRIDNIHTCYNNILSTAQQAVNEHVASDKTLIDDLDSINALLAGKTGLEAGLNGNTSNPSFNRTQEELDKMPTAEREKYLAEKEKYEKDLKFKNSHGGYSEESWNHLPDTVKQDILKNQAAHKGGNISEQNETAVDDKYSMSSDLDKVADEIIQGKYGNGDDRFAELEKQGYNLRDRYENGVLVERGLQDIVNEKLNGTYDPNKTPSFNNSEAGYKGPTNNNSSSNTSGQNPSSTSGNSTGNTGSSTTSGNSAGNTGSSTTSGNSAGNSGSSTTSGNSAGSQSSNSLKENLVDINPIYYGGLKNIDKPFEDVYKESFQVEPFKTHFPQQSGDNLLEKSLSGNSATTTTSGNGTYILNDDPYTGN